MIGQGVNGGRGGGGGRGGEGGKGGGGGIIRCTQEKWFQNSTIYIMSLEVGGLVAR